ncbi:hypothetical protein [Sphingobium estronivorans]|nr:hypothetical protein [Sphingobium estronivorans]
MAGFPDSDDFIPASQQRQKALRADTIGAARMIVLLVVTGL